MIQTNNLPWIDLNDNDCAKLVSKFMPECNIIVEAGTCAAEDTIKFKKIWPNAEVYTFEPNAGLYEIASRNIKESGLSGITIYNCALSNHCDRSVYYASAFPGTSSFFKNNMRNILYPSTVIESIGVKDGSEIPIYSEVETSVPCVTIDSLDLTPDFIWLDVEGAELIALEGAKNTMPKTKCIYLELNHQQFRSGMAQFDDVIKFMDDNGFDVAAIWKAHDNWQSNGIFLNRAKK